VTPPRRHAVKQASTIVNDKMASGDRADGYDPACSVRQGLPTRSSASEDYPMTSNEPKMTVLVYSDDRATRDKVRLAIGRRPAADLPLVEIIETATHAAVIDALEKGGVDLAVLDGEAVPIGGMGIARQAKEEIFQAPPILLLIGRRDDAWLATWSRAEAAVAHPLDPMEVASAVADLLRRRAELRAAS
jgi:DNA-binding NtrC family response regulator